MKSKEKMMGIIPRAMAIKLHVVVMPNHKIIFLLLNYYNFGNAMNCNAKILGDRGLSDELKPTDCKTPV